MMALLGTAAGPMLLVGAKAGFSSPTDQALPAANRAPLPGPSGSPAPATNAGAPPAPRASPTGTSTKATKTAARAAPKPTPAAPKPPRTTMKDGTFAGNPIYVEYG